MNPAYFGQCSCCINIDKNNYPQETELDTSPSLTLSRTLTLSTGERSFGHYTYSLVTTPRFLILCTWIHQKIWGGIQSLDQESIQDEKSQLHKIDASRSNMPEIDPDRNRSRSRPRLWRLSRNPTSSLSPLSLTTLDTPNRPFVWCFGLFVFPATLMMFMTSQMNRLLNSMGFNSYTLL